MVHSGSVKRQGAEVGALTSIQRPPKPGRPTVSLRQAARLLRRDPRTVQRMVRDGELEGGYESTAHQRARWYVYSDQLSAPIRRPADATPSDSSTASQEIMELREEVAAAKAQAAQAIESNRLILASQAMLLTALSQYRNASNEINAISEDYRAIIEDYRGLIERHAGAAQRYRDSADSFADILENYRDIVSQFFTPNDASALTEH